MDLSNVKYVEIAGRKYEIEGEVTDLNQVKAKAVEFDSSLVNADPVVSGDTIVFQRRAGTKGAGNITKVVVKNITYEVDPMVHSDPESIKQELLKSHPDLINADYVVSGDTMTFVYKAGTKGC